MELKGLREEEALHLLLKIADIAEPWDASTKAAGNQITRTLGYLALAVIQAGNSIYQKLCNLGDYLGWHEHYRRKRQQSHAPGTNQNTVSQHDDENEDVYSAFDFSFQYIEARNTVPSQDAIEILNIVGFLHFDRIPIDLFTRGIDLRRKQFSQFHNGLLTAKIVSAIANRLKPPPPLPRMLKRGPDDMDPFCVREALWELYAFSLIVYDKDGESFSLHPLVHSWAKDRIPQPERELWAMIAFHTLMASVPLPGSGGGAPDSDFETGLIPHLNACLDACPKEFRGFHGLRLGPFRAFAAKFFQPSLLLTLRDEIQNAAKCGALYAKTGNFSKAAYYLSIAKGALTELLGSDDSRTTAAKLGLAAMLWGLGRLEEGISLQKEVVQSRSKMLGPEHRETLQAMDSLGHSYWLNGQYVEALSLQNETAQKMARSLGENDDDTLNAFDHLGVTLSSWHRYEESRELHQAVLEYRKRTLGQNHLKTLETMNNLAMALLDLKQIDDAKTLMEYVYENRKTQMGKEHPYTLWALCYLSKIYVKKGLLQLAEGILTEGIAAGKRSLDDDHLGVLMGCGELSRLYARQGRLEEAKKLSLETLKKIKKSRGAEHPDYAYGMWKLGQLYALGKESMKAIAAHKVALESIKARLTTEHPLYALVRESLACLINQPGSTGGEEVEVPHPAIASCTSAVA
jgi:tetratricopeptide (TPR) repeat protein